MPAQKNKASFEIDGREKRTSVVQRFIDINAPEETEQSEPVAASTPEVPGKSQYHLKNAMEEAVVEEVTASLKHITDICKCEKCFFDICALVLNVMPPHYATSEQGELMTKANTLLNIEIRAKVSKEVFKAIEKVKAQPLHG